MAKATKEKKAKPIGEITHYYDKLGVGIIKLKAGLKKGDAIAIKGHTTDISQTADSLQLDHKDVDSAKKGDEVGIKVSDKVRDGDEVYLATS